LPTTTATELDGGLSTSGDEPAPMRALRAAALMMGVLALVPQASALGLDPVAPPGDPTPGSPNAVQTVYSVALRDGLDAFDIDIHLLVLEAEIYASQGTPAQAIRDGGPGVHALFEQAVKARVDQELRRSFSDTSPRLESISFDYGTSDLDADPYRPGVEVQARAVLPVTPSLLGVPVRGSASGADWARAFLYSGGLARIEHQISVPPGFDAARRIEVPSFLHLAAPGPQEGTSAAFFRNNSRGSVALPLRLLFELRLDPHLVPANVREGPIVHALLVADDETPLWLQAIPFTQGRYAADLDLRIELPSIPTSLFQRSPLPPHLRLQMLSADLMRAAVRDGVVNEPDVLAFFDTMITQSLQSDFGPSVKVRMDEGLFHEGLQARIGGADGKTVEPLWIHATSRLPLHGDRMLASSSVARSLGMITGTQGSFTVANAGDWGLELTLLYPKGADVHGRDSLGRLHEVHMGGRDGFMVALAHGEKTRVHLWGRPAFDAPSFATGLLELGVLLAAGLWIGRHVREWVRDQSWIVALRRF
jgi:hypothetical protein